MVNEETRKVTSWDELVKFVQSVNPYKKTIVLTGWINYLVDGKVERVKELVFSTKDVEILSEDGEHKTKRE